MRIILRTNLLDIVPLEIHLKTNRLPTLLYFNAEIRIFMVRVKRTENNQILHFRFILSINLITS